VRWESGLVPANNRMPIGDGAAAGRIFARKRAVDSGLAANSGPADFWRHAFHPRRPGLGRRSAAFGSHRRPRRPLDRQTAVGWFFSIHRKDGLFSWQSVRRNLPSRRPPCCDAAAADGFFQGDFIRPKEQISGFHFPAVRANNSASTARGKSATPCCAEQRLRPLMVGRSASNAVP